MAQETLVAVFDTTTHADAAVAELERSGIATADIERHSKQALSADETTTTTAGHKGGFWGFLFGDATTPEQNSVYDSTVRSGGEVVTVLLHDGDRDADRVMTILEKYSPIDVSERAASYGTTAAVAPTTKPVAVTGDQTIQLSEESLAVGKREVSRGTTRLHRFVRSKEVEENITLRDETVSVERRMVNDGSVVAPDAFTDKVIEMTETDEEAVVAKTARVREEVVLHKDVSERVETVRDTLRSEELEVEKIPGTSTTGTVETVRTVTPGETRKPGI